MVGRLVGKSSKLVTTVDSTTVIEYILAYDAAKIDCLDRNLIQVLDIVSTIVEYWNLVITMGTIAQAKKPRSDQMFQA